MKAAVYHQYGDMTKLNIEDMEKPTPNDHQVLVRVKASSINISDWFFLQGKPFPLRLMSGLFKPKNGILGADISGIVETVGKNVTEFHSGDEVVCDLSDTVRGGYAQYVCVSKDLLVKKPSHLTFEMAAAIPLAGTTALYGLNLGSLKENQRILIIGATSGVGSLAASMAKAMGAHVTVVGRTDKVDALQALQADEVINSDTTDVTTLDSQYDLILDCAAYRPIKDYFNILKGAYVLVGGSMKNILAIHLKGKTWSKKTGKKFINYLAKSSKEDIQAVMNFFEEKQIEPLIDSVYTLDNVVEAYKHYRNRKATGKIVISIP